MSESKLRKEVLKWLKPLHGVSVENMMERGTPDINWSGGWMELKYVAAWPKKEDTLVRTKNRPAQIPWAKRRVAAGGIVFWLVKIEKTYLLFDMATSPMPQIGSLTRNQMIEAACCVWSAPPSQKHFLDAIKRRSVNRLP
jgi:hypothetical protein